MAIEKKLICFARLEEFERQLAAGNILDYSIVFIQDAKKIWTRGTYYDCNSDIKQDTLVSGTNIKTINGESIVGSGDIVIEGGETLTESDIAAMGFTKNTGTVNGVNISGTNKYPDAGGIISLGSLYSKPSNGIPKTDLDSAVQTSLGKADTALQSYTEQYKGTVTGVKVNGSTKSPSSGTVDIGNVVTSVKINGSSKSPSSGVVDLGTVITSHQTLKTINGQSIVGSGDITIQGGEEVVDNVYITDFTVNDLNTLIDNSDNGIQASIIELQNAITAHKIVLVPYDANDETYGYGVATGYIEDFLYVTITLDNGRFIDIELPLNSTDIKGQEVRERYWYNKQDRLVSGTNIKTINGTSILGSGNIEIESGGEANVQSDWLETNSVSDSYVKNRTHYVEGTKISTSGSHWIGLNTPIYYREKVYNLEVGVRTQIDTNAAGVYVTLSEGGVLNVEDVANLLSTFPIIAVSKIVPLDDMFIPEHIVREENVKTINGQSILGSGNIEISGGGSGGGEDIRYFTDFTVELVKDCAADGVTIAWDATGIIEAARNNKLICIPYADTEKGYTIASYKFTDGEEYSLLFEASIFDDGVNYFMYVGWTGETFTVRGNGVNIFSPQIQVVEVVDGAAECSLKDNSVYYVFDTVEYLYIYYDVDLAIGSTIRFLSGENTTIEYWGNWANGVIPTIEPYTAYEMSIVFGADYYPCAVLTPFKLVE